MRSQNGHSNSAERVQVTQNRQRRLTEIKLAARHRPDLRYPISMVTHVLWSMFISAYYYSTEDCENLIRFQRSLKRPVHIDVRVLLFTPDVVFEALEMIYGSPGVIVQTRIKAERSWPVV